jgi:hypothetical protein
MSLEKAPESHKATLESYIANLEELALGFERQEVMEKAPKKPAKKEYSLIWSKKLLTRGSMR